MQMKKSADGLENEDKQNTVTVGMLRVIQSAFLYMMFKDFKT
jgi:hypothetical protein